MRLSALVPMLGIYFFQKRINQKSLHRFRKLKGLDIRLLQQREICSSIFVPTKWQSAMNWQQFCMNNLKTIPIRSVKPKVSDTLMVVRLLALWTGLKILNTKLPKRLPMSVKKMLSLLAEVMCLFKSIYITWRCGKV